ncbi:MAG: hypothetical protein WB699_02150 [Bacteroidota bacterium]
MVGLDLVLFLVFAPLFLLGSAGVVLCFRKSLRVAGERDGDLKMFFWAFGGMICLIVAGMSAAYFLIPLIFHR